MFLSEEQIDGIRAATERRAAHHDSKEENMRALVLKKMKKERDIQQRHYAATKRADELRRIKTIWIKACEDVQVHARIVSAGKTATQSTRACRV